MDNTCTYDDLLLSHDDVLIQILVYLPAISLLRFKSVCKSWRALIDSSFFIHLHATSRSTTLHSSSNFGTFIFQTLKHHSDNTTEGEILMLSAASSRSSHGGSGDNDDKDQVFEVKSLGFPPHYKVIPRGVRYGQEILMVGSCNGLICLHDSKLRDVSLWNPVTRQFRILPKSLTLEEGIGDFDLVGFGLDIKTKDYKVVQITWFRPYNNAYDVPLDKYAYRVQVYSLSTDSWRLLEGINSLPAVPRQRLSMDHGLYLNGSYFFKGFYNNRIDALGDLILSFDFTKEIFTTMQFPDQHKYCWFLTNLGEKIALFGSTASGDSGYDHNIWVLNNEHGVKESWTKLHSNIGRILPRGISSNGEFAFINTRGDDGAHKLVLYNLVTKEVKKDFPIGNKMVVRADVYKQSLVSVISGNGEQPPPRRPDCISDEIRDAIHEGGFMYNLHSVKQRI